MSRSSKLCVAVADDDDESLCRSLRRLLRAAHFRPICHQTSTCDWPDRA
jgi:hypothetical protein